MNVYEVNRVATEAHDACVEMCRHYGKSWEGLKPHLRACRDAVGRLKAMTDERVADEPDAEQLREDREIVSGR